MFRALVTCLPVALLQLGLPGGVGAPTGDLAAAARASGRPPECAASEAPRSGSSNAWDDARDARVQKYCELVARGMSQLASQPETARTWADLADRELPGHAAPWVLRARASSRLRRHSQAAEEYQRAGALDPHSLDDPLTMGEWARALQASGHPREALAVYRALVPNLSAFASEERARTLLDAAELAATIGAPTATDAVTWVREAYRVAPRELAFRAAAFLALSLDRAGASDEALAVASELGRRKTKRPDVAALSSPEQIAALAFAMEPTDNRAAQATWQRYLVATSREAPFRAHAEQRLARLRQANHER